MQFHYIIGKRNSLISCICDRTIKTCIEKERKNEEGQECYKSWEIFISNKIKPNKKGKNISTKIRIDRQRYLLETTDIFNDTLMILLIIFNFFSVLPYYWENIRRLLLSKH